MTLPNCYRCGKQPSAAARKLTGTDIAELRACLESKTGWIGPRFAHGRMVASQWRSWNKLERLGCGDMYGGGEVEEFEISTFGRQVLECS